MTKLTYREIDARCKAAAQELCPELPETGTLEAWESFYDDLDALDVSAFEEVDGWDWAIYTHYGFAILEAMDSPSIHDAEARWHEFGGLESQDDSFGPYEFAAQVAYHLLVMRVEEELYALAEELKELAQNEIDNRSE